RTFVFFGTQLLYFIALIVGRDLFNLGNTTYINLILLVALLNYSVFIQRLASELVHRVFRRYAKKGVLQKS
ncbi:hypothetical protein ACM6QN_13860, partial [Enterococcus faecium]